MKKELELIDAQQTQTPNSVSRVPKGYTLYHNTLMTDLDDIIDDNVAIAIQDSPFFALFAAWHFCGFVWWQKKKWCCEVWSYNSWCGTFVADTLSELKRIVESELDR